jgi:hypothetical protein
LEIEKLDSNKEPNTVKNFYKIVKTYIKENSEKEVNLSGESKIKFFRIISNQKENETWKLNSTPVQLLEPFRQIIHANLYVDVFPRYMKSKICYDAILSFLNDENVISKNVCVFSLTIASICCFIQIRKFHSSWRVFIRRIKRICKIFNTK